MVKRIKPDEKIIVQIDPFTNEVSVQNCTRYNKSELELSGDADHKDENHIITISMKIVLSERAKSDN